MFLFNNCPAGQTLVCRFSQLHKWKSWKFYKFSNLLQYCHTRISPNMRKCLREKTFFWQSAPHYIFCQNLKANLVSLEVSRLLMGQGRFLKNCKLSEFNPRDGRVIIMICLRFFRGSKQAKNVGWQIHFDIHRACSATSPLSKCHFNFIQLLYMIHWYIDIHWFTLIYIDIHGSCSATSPLSKCHFNFIQSPPGQISPITLQWPLCFPDYWDTEGTLHR